jgi:hypothetical protein
MSAILPKADIDRHRIDQQASQHRTAARSVERYWGRDGRRRECDWDPTVSKFVARISLGGVRLGSNSRAENTTESAHRISRSRVWDWDPTRRINVRVCIDRRTHANPAPKLDRRNYGVASVPHERRLLGAEHSNVQVGALSQRRTGCHACLRFP